MSKPAVLAKATDVTSTVDCQKPMVSCPGLAFANLTASSTVLNGESAPTVRYHGESLIEATGTKSLSWS